jgi:hypothetical protein
MAMFRHKGGTTAVAAERRHAGLHKSGFHRRPRADINGVLTYFPSRPGEE